MRFFSLGKAAQGFAARRTLYVRRSRKPAENAVQRKKDHLWMDTDKKLQNRLFGWPPGDCFAIADQIKKMLYYHLNMRCL
jgi:hypothetical protein